MKSLSISVVSPNRQPIPIMPPDNKVAYSLHDFACNDPRHGETVGYIPRTYSDKAGLALPEAFKCDPDLSHEMSIEWATLWHDLLGMYAPKYFKTSPADLSDQDYSWLNGFVPKNELDKQYLMLIHGARFGTNKTGPNNIGYYDPYTGYGTPGSDGSMRPYRKEEVDTGGNYYWWSGEGTKVWAIDGKMPAPKAGQLRDMFFLVHIGTQCSNEYFDSTPRPDIGCPNGLWKILEFPQGGSNITTFPFISDWDKGRTMDWNGIYLRETQLPSVRFSLTTHPEITWPYIPNKPLIVTF